MPRRKSSSPKASIANEMRTRRNAASIDASSSSIVDALEPLEASPRREQHRATSLLSTAATSAARTATPRDGS